MVRTGRAAPVRIRPAPHLGFAPLYASNRRCDMKRWWVLLVFAGVACVLLGCVPRRLFWSPNGRHGAVLGQDNGLYLCDPAGKLSKLIAPDVQLVAWFPDSKRFIATRAEQAGTWEEARRVFTE